MNCNDIDNRQVTMRHKIYKIKNVFSFLIIVIAFVLSAQRILAAESLEEIKVVKISAEDERAVIKTAERTLQVINVGDRIGENAKVVEITKGRVVIEEKTQRGVETVIIRVGDGKQRLERIQRVREERLNLYAPP